MNIVHCERDPNCNPDRCACGCRHCVVLRLKPAEAYKLGIERVADWHRKLAATERKTADEEGAGGDDNAAREALYRAGFHDELAKQIDSFIGRAT